MINFKFVNHVLEGQDHFKINDENFIKVSAKTGENIKEAFKYLLDIVEQNSDENNDEEIIIKNKTKKNKLKNKGKKKVKCC